MSLVFIVGAPRSGTSMLGWAIAQHSRYGGCPEMDFIVESVGRGALRRSYDRSRRRDGFIDTFGVSFETYAASLGQGFLHVIQSHVDAPHAVDATPRHTRIWRELSVLFPEARFIHMLRRGPDVVRSLVASGFSSRSSSGFIPACLAYRHYVSCGLELEAELPERTLCVRYEVLTGEPEAEMDRIFPFLGDQAEPACAAFIREKRINASFGESLDAHGEIQRRPERRPLTRLQSLVFRSLCGRVARRAGAGSRR